MQKGSAEVCVYCLFACWTPQQNAKCIQGQILPDSCMCCHTGVWVACYGCWLIQSQYTDTGPTSPSTKHILLGAWQGSHQSSQSEVLGMTWRGRVGFDTMSCAPKVDALSLGPRDRKQRKPDHHLASFSIKTGDFREKRVGRIFQSVVYWAPSPAWCSVVGSILFWASDWGDFFPLELAWVLTPFPQNSFRWEYKPRSSLCTHAFQCADSIDPDIHVLDGWILAAKTHPAWIIHEDWMWLPQWLDLKNGHIRENLTQNGEPQRYSWEWRRREKREVTSTEMGVFSVKRNVYW